MLVGFVCSLLELSDLLVRLFHESLFLLQLLLHFLELFFFSTQTLFEDSELFLMFSSFGLELGDSCFQFFLGLGDLCSEVSACFLGLLFLFLDLFSEQAELFLFLHDDAAVLFGCGHVHLRVFSGLD